MTNEEIIKGLQATNEHIGKHFNEGGAWMAEFIDNAITALEQQSFEGKTNGDVIKAMFPNIRIIDMPDVEVVQVVNEENDIFWGESRNFHYTWWNSSYKECDEE